MIWTTQLPTASGYYWWREPGTAANGMVLWSSRSNDGTDVGEPDAVDYVGRPAWIGDSMADTAGETIVIDGTIAKEDLDRFTISHSEPPV